MKVVKKFVFACLSITLLISCDSDELDFDNIQVPNLQGIYTFSIGHVTYRLDSLIEDDMDSSRNLVIDPETSEISFIYRDSLGYSSPDDLVDIGDVIESKPVDLPIGVTSPGSIFIRDTVQFTYITNDEGDLVDSIFYSNGLLSAGIITSLDLSYTLTIENTRVVASDEPVIFTGTSGSIGSSIDLANPQHKTTLNNENGENTFDVLVEATINLLGATILPEDFLNVEIRYTAQDYAIVYGKFGRDTINIDQQTIDIEFFEDIESDGFFFGNPQVFIDFTNDYGVPFSVDFSSVFGDKGDGTNQIFLSGSITESPETIDGAEQPGNSAKDQVIIDKSNSNLVDLLAASPSRIVFDVNGITNPPEASFTNNFLTPSDSINAFITIEIPLEVRLVNVKQSGTLDLGDGIDTKDVDSLFMRLITINELPFSGVLSVEIMDQDTIPLYTVTDKLVLNAPFLNVNGEVTEAVSATTDIPIAPEGVDALETGSHIKLTVTLNTPGSLLSSDIFVKLLADYEITVDVGLGGKLNVDL